MVDLCTTLVPVRPLNLFSLALRRFTKLQVGKVLL